MYLLFHLIHLIIFSYNGKGFLVVRVISALFSISSQVIISSLIIFISFGWSISFTHVHDKDAYIVIFIVILLLNMIIMGLTVIDYGAETKYHDFSGVQGVLLVLLRLGMYFTFVIGMF